jgi:hypothetical protein
VKQSVFWIDKEILKHTPDGMSLYDSNRQFDITTAKAAKSAARQVVIDLWQRRFKIIAAAEAAKGIS